MAMIKKVLFHVADLTALTVVSGMGAVTFLLMLWGGILAARALG